MSDRPSRESAETLERLLNRVARLRGAEDLSLLHAVAEEFDLRQVSYLGVRLPKLTRREPFLFSTFPTSWLLRYRQQSYLNVDPVITQAANFVLPTDWGKLQAGRSKPVKQLFGEAREFGLGTQGISLPLRGRHGELALFSLTSDLSKRDWDAWKRLHAGNLQLLGYHIHDRVMAAEAPAERAERRLAPREIDVLRWAARGRTVRDTAEILDLSERTIRFYLELARTRLNALNTTHAVAIALEERLIDLID
ncbi:LuxR family transcriptional regulator [Aureimonas psammosilenae]|uniref:LuxR family transcriptional regulator n=1 Tax=Aureimonas psammosilenae TaxID=2495496 RepID=UPI001260F240|nr:LuxR family transcriptional regulator [Aureimonas psammosilenae]